VSDSTTPTTPARTVDASLRQYTNLIYALHALAVLIGVLTHARITHTFIFGVPSLVAVIMNYVRRKDAEGTAFAPHFRWQIRTFWFAVLWYFIIVILSLPLMLALIGFITLRLGLALLAVWVVYRLVRGWLALRDGKPLPSMGTP